MTKYDSFLEVRRIYIGSQIFIGDLGTWAMYERERVNKSVRCLSDDLCCFIIITVTIY